MKLPARYLAARKALDACLRVDEAKDIRDIAMAMELYAYQRKDAVFASGAVELKRRAVRRIGELMEAQRRTVGLAKGGQPHQRKNKSTGVSDTPVEATLSEAGIDKNLAKDARRANGTPKDQYDAETERLKQIAAAVAEGDKAVIKQARTEQQRKKKARRQQREYALAEKQLAMPTRQYGVIVADPEWQYEPWSHETGMDRAAANHYPTSVLPVIAARDVPSISAKDCVLFLWATIPMLPHAIAVMGAWGFDYVSHYAWGKDKFGTGFWMREKHELLLIGTRGKPPCPAQGDQWDSLIMAPRGKHSEKPECFLEMIEKYFPNLPKIELNRRGSPRAGWDAWGLEAETASEPPIGPGSFTEADQQSNGLWDRKGAFHANS
jgi:N6-adenosine-specific RNA methylase IME4